MTDEDSFNNLWIIVFTRLSFKMSSFNPLSSATLPLSPKEKARNLILFGSPNG